MDFITSKIFKDGSVAHGFSIGPTTIEEAANESGIKNPFFIKHDQIHSDKIVLLSTINDKRSAVVKADAFISTTPGIICYIRTADCVPILLHDPVKKIVAAVHAGWKGTAQKITLKTIDYFVKELGSKPQDIRAAIGPAILGKCYEIGQDVADEFAANGIHLKEKDRVDTQELNRTQLAEAGVDKIEIARICTHCDDRFISFRRDKEDARRQVNFIALV